MLTLIVLVVLAGAWCAYFAVWFRESRSTALPRRNSTQAFSRFLGALDDSIVKPGSALHAGPVRVGPRQRAEMLDMPRTARDARRRRRHVSAVLTVAAVVSLVAAVQFGPALVLVHLMVDTVLVAFMMAVARLQHAEAEREMAGMNVRVLYPDRPAPDDGVVVPLRRTASG